MPGPAAVVWMGISVLPALARIQLCPRGRQQRCRTLLGMSEPVGGAKRLEQGPARG